MKARPQSGLTIMELAVAVTLVAVLFSGIMLSVNGLQSAFSQNEAISRLQVDGERALQRLVRVTSQAVTSDPEFQTFAPNAANDGFRGLRFRVIDAFVNSTPQYDDNAIVFVYGPNPGAQECAGVVIGRGTSLASIHTSSSGDDDILGTRDDNTDLVVSDQGVLELLLPDTYAPTTGEMLHVETVGRQLTITLRVNLRDREGDPLLEQDLVFQERVALRQ